jgi:hypothetical protein
MAAFLAFLSALPAFLQALPDLLRVGLKVMQVVTKFKDSKWRVDVEDFVDKLIVADTVDKKRDAARAGIDLIRKL